MRSFLPLLLLVIVVIGCNSPTSRPANSAPAASPTPVSTFAEIKKEADELIAIHKKNPDASIKERVAASIQALSTATVDQKEKKAAADLTKQLESIAKKISDEEAILGPMPEKSGYDSRVEVVDNYLRRTLNDYNSSEYVEWNGPSVFRDSTGPYWVVRLRLRAKNGFGAMILRDTYYFIRNGNIVKTKGL